MGPLKHFEEAWSRCDQLTAIHAYLAANLTGVLQPDELLRAEWAARVSALDLYIHEVAAQYLLEILLGSRPLALGTSKFQISASILLLSRNNPVNFPTSADLEIRTKLERCTFQFPDDIADGIRFVSDIELWNEIALFYGATEKTKVSDAKAIKSQLSQIVNRRNKIVHEADLQPSFPRTPWPISAADLQTVREHIQKIVYAIDAIV